MIPSLISFTKNPVCITIEVKGEIRLLSFSLEEFQKNVDEIEEAARKENLDFFDMRYEICPADVVYTIAGFGMLNRFSHWSFGKHYYASKRMYELGLSKIYELVVNTDPCVAFFLESNTMIQNKLIIAHVIGHSDFFKNNASFRMTNRKMINSMESSSERIKNYEEKYGKEKVEMFLDAVLAIQSHVDPFYVDPIIPKEKQYVEVKDRPYDDLFISKKDDIDTFRIVFRSAISGTQATEPTLDILKCILEHGKYLDDWQADILSSMREESLYFWPQRISKLMNEGWASYWHMRLVRQMDLTASETIDFAKLASGVMSIDHRDVNPYNVGYAMWERIEELYGREKMFEIRETESDYSFILNYLDQETVDKCELWLFDKNEKGEVVPVEKDVEKIRPILLRHYAHGGVPIITANVAENGRTLELKHEFDELTLSRKYCLKTLPLITRLWGDEVTFDTQFGQEQFRLSAKPGSSEIKSTLINSKN